MSKKAPRRKSASPTVAAPRRLTVACFGELLWDCLPRGLFLGGAPMNAAYHLAQQGLTVWPVTAVGRDFLGDEALRRLAGWGLVTRFVGRRAKRPTGTVRATLDRSGVASYDITRGVAWDHIQLPVTLPSPSPAAVVYGTLALRTPGNRRTLARLLKTWPHALRVVDLNFRAPFVTPAITAWVLKTAHVVKLNDEELGALTGRSGGTPVAIGRAVRQLAERYDLGRVCVTAGARGAGLWWDGQWLWQDARPVVVADTVGAGDAFLAGLLGALLVRRATPAAALAQACRLGEFVAAHDGATPAYHLGHDGQPRAS